MKDLTQGSIGGHLVQMSSFIGVGMLVQTLYYLVDLYFVAGLGQQALAGVSTAGNVMFVVLALTQVLSVGTVTLISHAVGRKDQADANLVFNQALLISSICSALMLIAGYTIGAAYVREIAADGGVAQAGQTYLFWFVPGLALQFALVGMGAALRGTGIVKPTMIVQSLTLILNTILAPVLIAGWGTGHPLGVKGAALASSISISVGVILLIIYFARLEKYVRVDRTLWKPRFSTWKRMLNIGLPAGGEFMIMFLIVGIIYWCIRDFGAAAQAGFGIGARVMQSIFLPAMAVAFAASPIAGQNFGARQAQRVRETFRTAAIACVSIMIYALMPSPYLAIVMFALNYTAISIVAGPQNAALQVIVPNEMRGQVTAAFLFVFTMIGLAIAPAIVASLTQYVFGDESQLRYSIATMHIVLAPLATIAFWFGLKPYGKAFAAARAWH